jgi:hypothetical protein
MRTIRKIIRAIIYFFLGIIVFVLAIRMLVDFFNFGHAVPWFIDLSNIFLNPFFGLVTTITILGVSLNITIIFAIFSYVFFATLLEQTLTSLFFWDLRIILIELVMSFFKIIEFFLAYRLLLKIFAGDNSNDIRVFFYKYTDWLVNPLNHIFPTINLLNGHIELSVVFLLILIFIFDIFVEFFLVNFLLVERSRLGLR